MDKIFYQLKLINGIPFGTFNNFPALNLFSTIYSGHTRDKEYIARIETEYNRKVAYLNQIHSDIVVWTSKCGNLGEGDGLILSNDILGAVFTADCLPIIIADITGEHVAVVHAGWAGSLKGIALKAAELLKRSSTKELVAAIGPAAGACCYEVGWDLYAKFISAWPKEAPQSFRKNNGRLYLDLNRFHQLILDGVISKIYLSNQCTICSKEYHSFRRDRTVMRQMSLVGSRI